MRAARVEWADAPVRPLASRRGRMSDLFAVGIMCLILGLEIIAVMQVTGGPNAFRMMASEGMQQAE